MAMCNVFTTDTILVNTYDNRVTDFTQEMAQKKMYSVWWLKEVITSSMLRIQKITFVAGAFYPRDGNCLPHASQIIFCTYFGVK